MNNKTRREADIMGVRVPDRKRPGAVGNFNSTAEFLTAVKQASPHLRRGDRSKIDKRLLATAGSDEHGQYSDPHGGFLVPGELSNQILTKDRPTSSLLAFTEIPMTAPVTKIAAKSIGDESSEPYQGLVVRTRSETQSVPASRTEVYKVALQAETIQALVYSTAELLDDIATAEQFIIDAAASALEREQLYRVLHGPGPGGFTGYLNSSATITVAKQDAQTADTITRTNIEKMFVRCWRPHEAVWIANYDAVEALLGINGSSAVPPELISFVSEPTHNMTLMGRPVIISDFAPTLGDKGDISLIVPSEYLIGTRAPFTAEGSMHVRFVENEQAFRFTVRRAGAPWWSSPLTPRIGANTLSPFVVLGERA